MAHDQTQTILKLMHRYGIAHFDYSDETESLSLSTETNTDSVIKSPAAGLFFAHHPMTHFPERQNLPVKSGQILGFLKNGPLLRPVIAPMDCRIKRAKVPDGTLVGFADALYDIA